METRTETRMETRTGPGCRDVRPQAPVAPDVTAPGTSRPVAPRALAPGETPAGRGFAPRVYAV